MEETKTTRVEKLMALCAMARKMDDEQAEETRRIAMAMQVGYDLGRAEQKTAMA